MSLASQVSALATAIGNTLRDSYKPRLLPAGGTAGQVLAKNSATNYDAGWVSGTENDIFRALSVDVAGANVNTAQAIFSGLTAITLAANTTYEFVSLVNISRAAGTVSHTTSLLFGGTATLTSIDYLASVGNPTGNVLGGASDIIGNAATSLVVTAANAIATENLRIWMRGIVRVNAGGTFIPQFQYSVAPGGAPTIKRNSFIRFNPLGAGTLTALN